MPEQLERVGETALEGVEFGTLDDVSLEEVASVLDQTGLVAVAARVDLERFHDEYQSLVETYDLLDCSRFVVTDLSPDPFASEVVATENANRLSDIGNRLEEDGFELLYDVEFSKLTDDGGLPAFETFIDELSPEVGLQVDTGCARYEGFDPVAVMTRYPDRIPVVHLTDTVVGSRRTRCVELGAGEVDLERCVLAARTTDVEWITYEHQQTTDPLDSLVHAETLLPQLSKRAKESYRA
ncbi:sugar phosphate isomerase/epimerase family protein [Haloarchaeobius sp. TZWSO28]|uniref:sugar phosphate isomerase/epimerase family protein n=1 Tax=Haloarchaeobius sp. TZWSO28 TaxID=3446119 RepID=UPI003EBB5770